MQAQHACVHTHLKEWGQVDRQVCQRKGKSLQVNTQAIGMQTTVGTETAVNRGGNTGRKEENRRIISGK